MGSLMGGIFVRLYGWNSPPAELTDAVNELIADPEARLSRGPLEIPRMRIAPALVTLILLIPAAVWLFVDASSGRPDRAVGYGIFLAMGLGLIGWGIFRLIEARKLQLILSRDGAVIVDRHGRLHCPWKLFASEGVPAMMPSIPHRVHFSIHPDAIPNVTLTRPDGSRVSGANVSNSVFRFGLHDSVHLSAFFALHSYSVVSVLVALGKELADRPQRPTAGSPPRSEWASGSRRTAAPAAATSRPPTRVEAEIDHGDWLVVSEVRADFPPLCCMCGVKTEETYPLRAVDRFLGYFEQHVHARTDIPCCGPCRSTFRLREWLGRGTIFVCSMLVAMLGPMLLFGPGRFFQGVIALDGVMLFLWGFLGLFTVPVFWRFGRELFSPVKSRYLAKQEKLAFRFARPGYAEQTLAYLQNPSGWKPPGS